MDRLKSIVVGVDFSPSSKRALEQALRLAEWNQSRLSVFHVQSELMRVLVAQDVGRGLKDLLAEVSAPARVETEIAVGNTLDQTLKIVRGRAADLLVIGAYGVLGDYLSGGVGGFATQCIRHVPAKLLLVHESCKPKFKKVVACIDFSETSEIAIQQALKIALADAGQLHLLHVSSKQDDHEQLRSRLEQSFARHRPLAPELDVRFVVADAEQSGEGIIRYARKIEADLLVLGTAGRTNLRYTLLGETVEWAIRRVRRSVLALKPKDFVAPVDRW